MGKKSRYIALNIWKQKQKTKKTSRNVTAFFERMEHCWDNVAPSAWSTVVNRFPSGRYSLNHRPVHPITLTMKKGKNLCQNEINIQYSSTSKDTSKCIQLQAVSTHDYVSDDLIQIYIYRFITSLPCDTITLTIISSLFSAHFREWAYAIHRVRLCLMPLVSSNNVNFPLT